MKFYVVEREDKTVLKECESFEEARTEMVRRVRQDIIDLAYEPLFYAIVDEENNILDTQ